MVISCSFFHKNYSRRPGARWKIFHKEDVQGVNYIWVYGLPYRGNGIGRILNLLSFAFFSSLFVLFNGKKGDVLYASSPQPLAPFFTFFLSGGRFFRVFEVRDFWPQIFVDMGALSTRSRIAKLFYSVERYLISHADFFVSNLSGAERYCWEKEIPYKEFFWVPNGVRESYDHAVIPRIDLKGKLGVDKILYAGAHGAAQNLYAVLDAAKELKDKSNVEFHFVGDGAEKSSLQGYVSKLGIGNVFFYDAVDTKKIKEFIVSADALLLPLVDAKVFSYGISPNKLPEYLAAGKPVIFFGPADASPFEAGVDAIVTSGTEADDLVRSVIEFENMPDEVRKGFSKSASRLLESKFRLDHTMGALIRKIEAMNDVK